MKAGNRSLITAAIAALVVFAVGAGSASALSPTVTIKGAKHKEGPYASGIQHLNVPLGKAKTVYWRVKNHNDIDVTVVLDDAATDDPVDGYRVTWFKGKKNISAEVKDTGYEFQLKGGAKKLFSTVVKHKTDAIKGFCLGAQVMGPAILPDSAYFGVNASDCD